MCVIDVSVKGKNVYNLKAFQLHSPRERCSILLFLNISISFHIARISFIPIWVMSPVLLLLFFARIEITPSKLNFKIPIVTGLDESELQIQSL